MYHEAATPVTEPCSPFQKDEPAPPKGMFVRMGWILRVPYYNGGRPLVLGWFPGNCHCFGPPSLYGPHLADRGEVSCLECPGTKTKLPLSKCVHWSTGRHVLQPATLSATGKEKTKTRSFFIPVSVLKGTIPKHGNQRPDNPPPLVKVEPR